MAPLNPDGNLEVTDPDEMEQIVENDLASHVKHLGTSVIPVFLLSLSNAPDQMMLDHDQLVAANRDAVVVMQCKPPDNNSTESDEDSYGYVYTRHMLAAASACIDLEATAASACIDLKATAASACINLKAAAASACINLVLLVILFLIPQPDYYNSKRLKLHGAANGKHLKLHGAAGVTANVVAGLAMSMAGIVPPYERYNRNVGEITQDWRWSHGAMPWGPYANSTKLSTIFAATARRNVFISHLEAAIHILQNRLDEVDAFVADNLQGPFHFLEAEDEEEAKKARTTKRGQGPKRGGHRHWLNSLANVSHGYNKTFTPDVTARLENNLKEIENKLEVISWSIYGHSFDEAEDALPALFAAVDLFSKHVKQDLELAQD
eukprot:gene18975-25551_t